MLAVPSRECIAVLGSRCLTFEQGYNIKFIPLNKLVREFDIVAYIGFDFLYNSDGS